MYVFMELAFTPRHVISFVHFTCIELRKLQIYRKKILVSENVYLRKIFIQQELSKITFLKHFKKREGGGG